MLYFFSSLKDFEGGGGGKIFENFSAEIVIILSPLFSYLY